MSQLQVKALLSIEEASSFLSVKVEINKLKVDSSVFRVYDFSHNTIFELINQHILTKTIALLLSISRLYNLIINIFFNE
ncbi:hypothetical protein [Halobacteriovorax sp. DPLXC-1]|uniref:hypothetical protein n=1 Tax=Halobacteriovorax sp. DPLXC-1 TaxID=3110771 RepID=UPI002FF19692